MSVSLLKLQMIEIVQEINRRSKPTTDETARAEKIKASMKPAEWSAFLEDIRKNGMDAIKDRLEKQI